jgi:hypothetical protein
MSLVNLVTAGKPAGHKFDKVMAAYQSLSPAEQDAFKVLVKDELWSGPQIAAELTKMGYEIQGHQIQNFRTKLKTGRVAL